MSLYIVVIYRVDDLAGVTGVTFSDTPPPACFFVIEVDTATVFHNTARAVLLQICDVMMGSTQSQDTQKNTTSWGTPIRKT